MRSESQTSYESIYSNIINFKKAGTKSGHDFNLYDVPGKKYFKILFHFYNGDVNGYENNSGGTGLLYPAWQNVNSDEDYYYHNSAYSYLIINNELERAEMLKKFISLLSNINSDSPWYFNEISGLDSALERDIYGGIKFDEKRKSISIKCLFDSFDDRIGTLMDLYRAIVWSHQMKREVIPANLRKFDMSLYIFESPVFPIHKIRNNSILNLKYNEDSQKLHQIGDYVYSSFGDNSDYKTSYKLIEFHNCEFDYNSGKTPYATLSNSEGLTPEYNITIDFDDCYETRYNEFVMKEIGDIILWDIDTYAYRHTNDKYSDNIDEHKRRTEYFKQSENTEYKSNIGENLGNTMHYSRKPGELYWLPGKDSDDGGFFSNAADQLLKTGLSWVDSKLKREVLGNIYTYSLTRISDQISTLMNGGVMETANAVAEYINDSRQRNEKGRYTKPKISDNIFYTEPQQPNEDELGDIFETPVKNNVNRELGDIFETPVKNNVNRELGNIFRAQTLANNI